VPVVVAALRAGARHYLVKPWDREELLLIVDREIRALYSEETRQRHIGSEIFWGISPGMRALRQHLEQLASSPRTTLLLRGETGTGKEVLARTLHALTRTQGEFVAVNCAAVPEQLLEGELFGHEKGAFTGADARRRGLVELADHGTLFLDEIGEMTPHLQAKLLRFLQDGRFRRLGGEQELGSTCRVVAASHADLEALQTAGRFRADLYFRLAVVQLRVPPLRDRREDVLALTHFLLRRTATRIGKPLRPLSPLAEKALLLQSWPGNVRELANRLERALVLGTAAEISPADLDLAAAGPRDETPSHRLLQEPARLRQILEEHNWNLAAAARSLGVERHRLKYRVRRFGLVRPAKK